MRGIAPALSQSSTEILQTLVGESAPMRQLRALVRRIASADSTVLILGESGTGKELVAQAIHQLSARRRHRFIPVNCGAIPSDLLESELFGHRKGSFTGALEDRRGRFELADSGTLFLDEIGDMRFDMQVKLLRVLQERVIDRIGEEQSRSVDVRVVAATHQHLEEAVSTGKFRADLFYRLNVFPVYVPALRERGDDICVLFQHFAARCARAGHEPIRAAGDLNAWLLTHDWPGNCRELLNFVERLSVLWPGKEITLRDIPGAMLPRAARESINAADERAAVLALSDWEDEWAADDEVSESIAVATVEVERPALRAPEAKAPTAKLLPAEGVDLKQILADYEAAWIREAMEKASGNITHAAELLGMRRTTFLERLRKYDPSESRQ
jgi:sigma-54 specific flagellar transcriptional regulator A